MTTIYILELHAGYYYIGKTSNIITRYQQHLNGEGSAWTKAHPPVSLVRTMEGMSAFDEDKVTKEYMAKYGIDRVRGGSYVEMVIGPAVKQILQREIWGAKGLCTGCGKGGHFVADCYSQMQRPRVTTTAFHNTQPVACKIVAHKKSALMQRVYKKNQLNDSDDSDDSDDSEDDEIKTQINEIVEELV